MPMSLPAPISLKEEVKRALDDGFVSDRDIDQIEFAAQKANTEDVEATYKLLEKHDIRKAPDADMSPASVVSLMRTIQKEQKVGEEPTVPDIAFPHAHFGGDDWEITLTPFGFTIGRKF